MRRFAAFVFTFLFCTAALSSVAAGKKSTTIKPKTERQVTRQDILALADKYIEFLEPKLEIENRQTISQMKFRLESLKTIPSKQAETIDDFVSQLTIQLAGLNSVDAITTASAYLVKYAPDNSRTTNLFGSALHTYSKYTDAVTALEYTLHLSPESTLAMLNLANACLDTDKDDRAKTLLDRIVRLEPDNRSAYHTLAYYWYKKKNTTKMVECMKKAAEFVGVVRKAAKPKDEVVEEHTVETEDSTAQMETKTNVLAECVPFTTADLIEDAFPDVARQIRDKYGKLIDSERMVMPRLPQINTSTNQTYTENLPIVGAWVQAVNERYVEYEKTRVKDKYGITGVESEQQREAKALKGAKKEMADSMESARQALEYMKNVPGLSKADISKAEAALKSAASQQGVKLSNQPVKMDTLPGFDSGAPYAQMNYANYVKVSNSHEQYIFRLMQDYSAKEADILQVYNKKIEEEAKYHQQIWDKLQEEHNQPSHPHGDKDIPCRREMLRHKKKVNEIGLNYYKQWVNLYMPCYAQKMKPAMDNYWKASMLYVKNMHEPKVMEREYYRVKDFFMTYAIRTTGSAAIGGTFTYLGPTEEEEAALQAAIRQAEMEAKEKKPGYLRDFDKPKEDWVSWIGEHLEFEVAGEFLGLKITPGTIEFTAWAFGPTGTLKVDMINSKLETSTGISAKAEVGIKVFGMGAKLESKVDIIKQTSQWDFENGTYKESYTSKAESKASLGPASMSAELEVDSQLVSKGSIKASMSGGGFSANQNLLSF
ncbi:tetratricopeptide repeat protein [bacterium]|nr:tetratricopeptide repeat protein [bacterium]